jgi:prophage tail gpP-like protein
MPLQNNVAYAVQLPVLSLSSVGTATITVTCSSVHNLLNNSQISVAGTANKIADGFYSVTVTSATAFTYMVNSAIAAGSLLTGTTKVLTAKVGLPYNYSQIPQAGV